MHIKYKNATYVERGIACDTPCSLIGKFFELMEINFTLFVEKY